jgi:hypothetical protein
MEIARQEIGLKRGILADCTPLCDQELKVVLKCTGTTWSIICRDQMNIAHISAGTGFWTNVD